MGKSCIECNEDVFGRSDKKFCTDYCRVNFYNRNNSTKNNLMRNVNNYLKRNRRILIDLQKMGHSKIFKSHLVKRGFMFEYFTNEYHGPAGQIVKFCYDLGYEERDQNLIAIVVRFDQVTV